jgi:hypothetical protein
MVSAQRHSSGDGVRNPEFVELLRDLPKRMVNGIISHEESAHGGYRVHIGTPKPLIVC